MPGFLQIGLRIEVVWFEMVCVVARVKVLRPGGDDGVLRIAFIGAGDLRCARHGDRMAVAGAAFGDHQVVIVAAARQMRCFNTAAIGTAAPDPLRIADNASRLRRILHQANGARFFVTFAGFPLQGNDPFFSVGVVQNGGIEPGRVEINRLTPRAGDFTGGN